MVQPRRRDSQEIFTATTQAFFACVCSKQSKLSILHPYQEQSLGRRSGRTEWPASLQQRPHVRLKQVPLACLQQHANDIPDHVLQKSAAADLVDQTVAITPRG